MRPSFLLFILLLLFAGGCANQVTPSGGTKDVTPPKLLHAEPANGSVHFAGQRILLHFDEYFTLDNAQKEVFVTPTLPHAPRYKVRNKTLLVELPDSLAPGTTYTIHFGNAIADVNEGNKLHDFQYVFSTGSTIDSLKLHGQVQDAFTRKPLADIQVMLYRKTGDSVVAKEKPFYLTHTDENGNFSLNHLHPGRYKMVALDDKDGNLLYTLPDEQIAFSDSLITVQDTSGAYSLRLFKPAYPMQKLRSARCLTPGIIQLAFARPSAQLMALQHAPGVSRQQRSAGLDTLYYASNRTDADTLRLYLSDGPWHDSVTVHMKNTAADTTLKKYLKPRFSNNLTDSKKDKLLPYGSSLEIRSSVPLLDIVPTATLTSDSTHEAVQLNGQFDDYRKVFFTIPFPEVPKHFTLRIKAKEWTNLFGQANDSIVLHFITGTKEETGNLHLHVQVKDQAAHYYIQLMSPKGTLIKQQALLVGLNEMKLENMAPGAYQILVFDDANGNGQWDSGNYWEHRQPETVILRKNDISIRANWDVDLDVPLGGKQGVK